MREHTQRIGTNVWYGLLFFLGKIIKDFGHNSLENEFEEYSSQKKMAVELKILWSSTSISQIK